MLEIPKTMIVERIRSRGGDGLLTGIQVDEARDITRRELYVQPLLELPDGAHYPIGVEQSLLAQLPRASNLRHYSASRND